MSQPPPIDRPPTPVKLVAADLSWRDVFLLSFKFWVVGLAIALAVWLPILAVSAVVGGINERRAQQERRDAWNPEISRMPEMAE